MRRCSTVLAFAAALAAAAPDPPWLELGVVKPEPGGRFESPVGVDLHIALLEGGLAEEVRAHPELYQVCYTGGALAVCTLLHGEAGEVGLASNRIMSTI